MAVAPRPIIGGILHRRVVSRASRTTGGGMRASDEREERDGRDGERRTERVGGNPERIGDIPASPGVSTGGHMPADTPGDFADYSYRSACTGSMRSARRAGSQLARSAVPSSTATTVANVAGSVAFTSYSTDAITRVSASAPATPATTPTTASAIP